MIFARTVCSKAFVFAALGLTAATFFDRHGGAFLYAVGK